MRSPALVLASGFFFSRPQLCFCCVLFRAVWRDAERAGCVAHAGGRDARAHMLGSRDESAVVRLLSQYRITLARTRPTSSQANSRFRDARFCCEGTSQEDEVTWILMRRAVCLTERELCQAGEV